jgi:hypothetical protein
VTKPTTGLAILVTAIVAAGAMFPISRPVFAQEQKATITTRGKPVAPIYNPHTKSYFELRIDLPRPPNWTTAVRYARTKFFKQTRGRLAVVKDIDTHSFLRANFQLHEEAWIGLRYYCSFRKLVWADGTEHPRSKFKIWAKKRYRTNVNCRRQPGLGFMPIYYLPNAKGYKWQASGPEKYFPSYFVEYRTGSENPKPPAAKESEKEQPKPKKADAEQPAPAKAVATE